MAGLGSAIPAAEAPEGSMAEAPVPSAAAAEPAADEVADDEGEASPA